MRYLWMSLICSMLAVLPVTAQTLDDAFTYSESGILAQRLKLTVVAENVANMMSLKDEETGLPYQKKYVVLETGEKGVKVSEIAKSVEPFGKYFDSTVPQSDENGFFYYPNVNMPNEMLVLSYTEAVYDANVNCFKTTKAMYQTALDILK